MGYRYSLSVGHIGIPPPINSTHRFIREPDLFLPSWRASAIWAFRRRVETVYFIKVVSSAPTLSPAVATCASVVRARRRTYRFFARGIQVVSSAIVAGVWTRAMTW